jgi:hypothetical protein
MKKAMLTLFALMVMCSMSALAQGNMGNMDHSSDKPAKASSGKMGPLKTVKGWVSDEKCGAKNASADGAACAKKCIDAGEKVVFVGDSDKKVWNVNNPEALKGHEGHHVAVKAHVNADDGSIHVMSVKMLSQGKASKKKSATT